MREIIAFIQKEFRHIFRDLRTTLIVLVMPVVQIILFGFAISTDVSNAVVDVVGDACDPLARSVISRIEGNKYLAVGEIHGLSLRPGTGSAKARLPRRSASGRTLTARPARKVRPASAL